MFLSIIIPVFNAEKYLEECLKSCFNQDLQESEYEIICINDGSSDNSVNIIRDFMSIHPNLILIEKENSGVSDARNIGLKNSKGVYVWFVDADDMIEEYSFQDLFNIVKATGADIIKFPIYQFYDRMTSDELRKKELKLFSYDECICYDNTAIWNGLYLRALLERNRLVFSDDLAFGEDTFFAYTAWLKSSKIIYLKERPFYYYRRNDSSVTANKTTKIHSDMAEAYQRIALQIQNVLAESEITKHAADAELFQEFKLILTKCMLEIAELQEKERHAHVVNMRKNGLFPAPTYLADSEKCRDYVCSKITLPFGIDPTTESGFQYLIRERRKSNVRDKIRGIIRRFKL